MAFIQHVCSLMSVIHHVREQGILIVVSADARLDIFALET